MKRKTHLNKLFTQLLSFFKGIFYTDYLNWKDSKTIPGLRKVEIRFILKYALKITMFYILHERKKHDLPINNFCFGEMPYWVSKEICDNANITNTDTVYDLGCGRGKFLFLVNLYKKARCIGVDLLPTYIEIANSISESLNLQNISFYQEDINDIDLRTASVVFINGVTFSKETHDAINKNIDNLKPGSKLISVGVKYQHQSIELFFDKSYQMSWGIGTVYFYLIK
jgi:SAM-dependent methyltransferase